MQVPAPAPVSSPLCLLAGFSRFAFRAFPLQPALQFFDLLLDFLFTVSRRKENVVWIGQFFFAFVVDPVQPEGFVLLVLLQVLGQVGVGVCPQIFHLCLERGQVVAGKELQAFQPVYGVDGGFKAAVQKKGDWVVRAASVLLTPACARLIVFVTSSSVSLLLPLLFSDC